MFKDRIRQLRLEHDMSQTDLAKVLQVTRQSISKYENGTAEPSFDKLAEMVAFFEISYDDLLGGEPGLSVEEVAPAPARSFMWNLHPTEEPTIFVQGKLDLEEDFNFTSFEVVEKYTHIPFKPDAVLIGINPRTGIFKGNKVELAWYRKTVDAEREMYAIEAALEAGEASYDLQYDVAVEKRGFFSVQLADYPKDQIPGHDK